MEVITGTASNLVTGVAGYVFQKVKRNFSYVCRYRRMVSGFERKVETLKDKRDGVLLDVDAAEKNGENIYPEVNSWLAKADKMTDSELKEVKGLEDEAKNKCFIGLCPNFKARYQLSKKAEEDAAAVDELLQQGGFDKVSYRDVPQPILFVPPKDFEDFDSRRLMFNKIMEAVKDPKVNIIGVHGMPGVGKTTLVKEVVRQVKEDKLFDSVVMAVVTHTPDVQKIQDQIADMLGLKFEEQSMTGRASRLCQRLKKEKKILVVLDDIWAKLDLMEVGIPLGDEDQGCTILLTSRDLNVLLDMDAKKSFPIGVLEHEEAWHFFKKIIGDGVESSDLLPIATEVAKKCGGLPIAIRTLATSLRNKPPFVWEDALRQLSKPSSRNFKGVPATVYSTIEWSFDRLQSEDHKQTFLLCSLMGHNASLDLLLVFAMGLGLFHGVSTISEARNKLLTVVSDLKASCLLLDGNTNKHFDMHDLISDVAMSITSKLNSVFVLRYKQDSNDWPDDETVKECDKISCLDMSELPDQLKCPKLTFLGMGSKDPWMKIPTNFFKETKNLKVLFLGGMNLSSSPSISLLGNLRALCLRNCVLGDIALFGELKNLEILSIASSDIEMLPKELGQLTKLKRLDLRSSSKLKRIPPEVKGVEILLHELEVGNYFQQLKNLHIQNGEMVQYILTESDAVQKIEFLELESLTLQGLPNLISFCSKKEGSTSISPQESALFKQKILFPKLKKLKQFSIGIERIWSSQAFCSTQNLTSLIIQGCANLKYVLSDSMPEYLQQLKCLEISECKCIQEIISTDKMILKTFKNRALIRFPRLNFLKLKGLQNLIEFCHEDYTVEFPALTILEIENCPELKGFIHNSMRKDIPTHEVLFNNKECDALLNIFSLFLLGFFQRLEKLIVIDCASLEQVFQLQVQNLNIEETYVVNSQLKEVNLVRLPKLEHIWSEDHEGNISFESLQQVRIQECWSLKALFPFSIAKDLQQLERLTINRCGLEEIVSNESFVSRVKKSYEQEVCFAFNKLSFLRLWDLPYLTYFYPGMHKKTWTALKQLRIFRCERIKIFGHTESQIQRPLFLIEKVIPQLENVSFSRGDVEMGPKSMVPLSLAVELFPVLTILTRKFDSSMKVAFPNLEKIIISHLRNAKRIWFDQLHTNSFSMLKELTVKECDALLNIFSPFLLGLFQRLEKLIVIDCASLEQVFQLQVQDLDIEETYVIDSQLKKVNLVRLPKLKHVWTKNHKGNISFESLQQVRIQECWSLKALFPFSIAKNLQQLEALTINRCGLEEIVSKSVEESDEQEICFAFNKLFYLELWNLPYLTYFYPRMHKTTWTALKQLRIFRCGRIKIFGHEESQIQHPLFLIEKVIPQLEKVSFNRGDIEMISDGQYESDLFCNIKILRISCYSNVSDVFPISFLKRFYNLESLELGSCNFKELASFESDACKDKDMIVTIPKIKKLKLVVIKNIRHLWKKDSLLDHICASLKCLEVWQCHNLINLGLGLSFFETLTTLDVWKCNKMLELITSSNARSLVCLVTMRIRECEMMREVVAGDRDEASYEIVFRVLKRLELHCLQNLTSFCSGNYTLWCPSLEQITLSQCPRMKNFYQGELITPKLRKVQLTETDFRGLWAGDLNATVEQLYKEQVGYRGLKHLKFSKFPELIDIWGKNPQEMLDFTTLEFLEICDSNNLRYIFYLSTAFCLGQLRQMEIKRCGNLEQVIKEKCSITMVEEAITDSSKIISIFPRLQSIIVESCPDMTSFYRGSKCLEFPSLVKIKVVGCSNMTTFISTFSRDEDKEAIIGDELDNVTTFFSDKLRSKLFSNLKELKVEHCDALLNIFPPFFLGDFKRLEKLIVADCASLEEVFQVRGLDIEEACIVTSELRQLSFLALWDLPNLVCFYPGMHNITCPMLKRLKTHWPIKIKKLSHVVSQLLLVGKIIPQLEHISLTTEDIATITGGQFAIDLFSHIKVLEITEYLNDSTVFSFRFLQRFSNLEKIEMVNCNFIELSPYEGDVGEERDVTMLLPRINQLTLKGFDKMTHLWKQGSPLHHICTNLETLVVHKCGSLINIERASSSLRNLTTLEVGYCKEMVELITSSKAQCSEQLVTLKIGGCEVMREVIASEGDEATYHEIIFKEMKCLELKGLQNLKSFCSGNYTLKFPSLNDVTVIDCPAIENFCNGALSTPKLQEVQTGRDVRKCTWDLNSTIEQLNKEEYEVSEETDKIIESQDIPLNLLKLACMQHMKQPRSKINCIAILMPPKVQAAVHFVTSSTSLVF
ncbi:hypothetical protein GOBAR_AA35710 [Gossypium barbadense]|uniref:AAA+ ATPase domain-containing protein n=2 Tax=Gossypium TaxID=3633 RepID=A0A2P5W1P5_GOSBA|nr:hypothetical protein GOBAR_AA35710 [Gossypium barbadense]